MDESSSLLEVNDVKQSIGEVQKPENHDSFKKRRSRAMRSPVGSSEKKDNNRSNAKKAKNIMNLIKDATGTLRNSAGVLSRRNSKEKSNNKKAYIC